MTNVFKYTCNPKYITEELLKDANNYEIVWIAGPKQSLKQFPNSVKVVRFGSWTCFKEVCSAKVWLENGICFSNYYNKKPDQIKLQTMHGSLGIKRLDNAVDSRNTRFKGRRVVKRESTMTDYVFTNSKFEEDAFRSVFWKDTKMLRLGHARTDILFEEEGNTQRYIRQRLKERYGIPYDKKLVLYGPTHRTGFDEENVNINFEELTKALGAKFGGEYVVLMRLHNRSRYLNQIYKDREDEGIYLVSSYPDIQELMLVTDVAITDYSSWIFDYVVTYKKGFLYSDDMERYGENTGLYYPLEESPFPVAYNNDALIENIKNFDESQYKKRVKDFLEEKQAVDDGNSAKRICEFINDLITD